MLKSLGSRSGTSQSQDYVLLGVLAIAGYIIYKIASAIPRIPDAIKPLTQPIADALATLWIAMIPASNMPTLGNVIFPDGGKVPISRLTVKQDSLGNVYVASPQNGLLLQLQPSNAQGDWPAVQITDPSQIGQAPLQAELGVTNPGTWGS